MTLRASIRWLPLVGSSILLGVVPVLAAASLRHHGASDRDLAAASSTKILGGSDAPANLYPFYAWWNEECGATLISSTMLLSAAHCLEGQLDNNGDGGNFGVVYLNSINRQEGAAYDVIQAWAHPQYNMDHYSEPEFDFILLKVNATIPKTVATPITLNEDPNIPSMDDPWLVKIGFGVTEDTDDGVELLQQVDIPYLPNDPNCSELYSDTFIGEAELCTLYPNNSQTPRDSCFGDSGGPVLARATYEQEYNNLGAWIQVGVISWGDGANKMLQADS